MTSKPSCAPNPNRRRRNRSLFVLLTGLFVLSLSLAHAPWMQTAAASGSRPVSAAAADAGASALSHPRSRPAKPSNALPYRPFPAAWQAKLDAVVAKQLTPGALVIVKSPGFGVRVGVAGYADLSRKIKPDPKKSFRIGSCTKMFVAQIILQLEQQGLIKLTDTVPHYLGDDPVVMAIPNIDRITIRELLQMTSGITNYLANPELMQSFFATPTKQYTPDDLLRVLGTTATPPLPPDFTPGATYPNPYWVTLGKSQPPEPPRFPSWEYSNSNYIILGKIAEKVTGLPVSVLLQRYITDKIGLTDTFLAENDKRLPDMLGYTRHNPSQPQNTDWCDVTRINPSIAWTAGAIISTPWDLLHFIETIFKTDSLLNAGTKQKWLSFVSVGRMYSWLPMEYGVGGLMQPHHSFGDARGHGGAFPGYKCLLFYFFDSDTTLVIAANTTDNEPEVSILNAVMPLVTSQVTMPEPHVAAAVKPDPTGAVLLSWQTGRDDASGHTVYIGTDPDQVDKATPENHDGVRVQQVMERHAKLTMAKPGTTYYWRVDSLCPDAIVPGPLWRFHIHAKRRHHP